METLSDALRVARKRHTCRYCGHPIAKGVIYRHQVYKYDGRVYAWRVHRGCQDLANAIWDFVRPDDGMMDGYNFCDALREVAERFVCSACPHREGVVGDCPWRLSPECLEHLHGYFTRHKLAQVGPLRKWDVVTIEKGKDR